MNDNFDQHAAQTPSPDTGSWHETHSVGSAMSRAVRAIVVQAPRQADTIPPSLPFKASLPVGKRDPSAPVSIR